MTEKELTKYDDDMEIMDIMPMMIMVMLLALFPTMISPVSQYLQAQAYQGKIDPRTIDADETLGWIDLIHDYPNTPWVSASFVNKGPDAVEIAINYPNNRFTLDADGAATSDHLGAQERIAIIFYICEEGETASLEIAGMY